MIKKYFSLNKDLITSFDKADNGRQKALYFATLLSFLSALVLMITLWVQFITGKGYQRFFNSMFRRSGESNITNSSQYFGTYFIIALVFLFLSLLLNIIDSWIIAGVPKKAAMLVFAIIGVVSFVADYLIYNSAMKESKLIYKVIELLGDDINDASKVRTLCYILLGIAIIAIVVEIGILLSINKQKTINLIVVLADDLVIFPLLLVALENLVLIAAIALALLFVYVLIKIFGSSSGGKISTPNLGSSFAKNDDKEYNNKKIDDKISILKHQISEYEDNIAKHSRGEFGYGTIDPKACQEKIDQLKKEVEDLEKKKQYV